MAPSQLKRLKASVHEQRSSKSRKQSFAGKANPKNSQDRSQQLRTQTLLPELQRRHKVGGIVDRRIGENDPRLAPEERMLQRFTAESQKSKRASIFNLEDGEDDELTHGGRPLQVLSGLNGKGDLVDVPEDASMGEHEDFWDEQPRKRMRLEDTTEGESDNAEAGRKKSKKEVMEEVIAKSKLHKYQRQRAKEEDEDTREELDKDLPDLLAALRGSHAQNRAGDVKHPQSNGTSNVGVDDATKTDWEKEYDHRVRQMAQDKKAQPTERTKTDEEKAAEEAQRLRDLEQQRLRRMRGESEEKEKENESEYENDEQPQEDAEEGIDEAAQFGFTMSTRTKQPLNVEDEDEFVIDEDLVASGSDVDVDLSDNDSLASSAEAREDDEEFLRDVRPEEETKEKPSAQLSYTYSCPQSLEEFEQVIKNVETTDIPTVVQRIRALYHAQLHTHNKEKMSIFSAVLVEYLPALSRAVDVPLAIVETLIRHVHSLSRTYGGSVAGAFRAQLQEIHNNPIMDPGQLVILTAIGSIYPTSDHFHPVVTPAITIIARWLGLTTPRAPSDSAKGAYLIALAIRYCTLSKRYIPEALRFTTAVLRSRKPLGDIASHIRSLRIMADLWSSQTAFIEMIEVTIPLLVKAHYNKDAKRIQIMLEQAQLRRRALELHHHKPLPIKTQNPKFEENFNPDKHYDPDRERTEAKKLQKEFKRERKGALRELKKDAEFIGREKLKEKKARDAAYEAKQRRLIAEINAEEGKDKNEYEREKRKRKGRR